MKMQLMKQQIPAKRAATNKRPTDEFLESAARKVPRFFCPPRLRDRYCNQAATGCSPRCKHDTKCDKGIAWLSR